MPITQFGFKPASNPTASIAGANRQFTGRISEGEYGNTITPNHQVAAGERLTNLAIYYRAGTNGVDSPITVNVYLTDSEGATEGALVATTVVNNSSSTPNYYSSEVDVDLSSYAGQYIKVAGGATSSGRPYYATVTLGDSVSVDNTANNPFGSATNRTTLIAMYGEISSGQEIPQINDGEPIIYGAASTWTTTGFDPAVNSGTVDGVAMTGVSGSGFGAFNLADGATVPRIGNRSVTATNGTQSANKTHAVDVPDTMSYVLLSDPLDDSEYSALPEGAEAGGWMLWYDSYDTNIYSDGSWDSTHSGSQPVVYISPIGVVTTGTILTGAGFTPETGDRGLTAVGLTATGLTMVGLTATGL